MIKRLIAVMLCLVMALAMLASCTTKKTDGSDKGAIINMYLTHEVYDFDPIYAYKNDSALQLVDLMFSSLFNITDNGKVENELAESYVVDEETNSVLITIKDGTYWSDGIYVTANDFVYTVKRILNPEFTCELASLLFDIKNARAVKNATGDYYVDDIGIDAVGEREVRITFEDGFTDYDGFKRTLASPALAPIREELVENNPIDWAKKPGTMACSGPFMLRKLTTDTGAKGLILERNARYFRETEDKLDKSVTPYRIVVDYSKTAEEQYEMYQNGELFYIGNIAMSLRGNDINKLVVKDSMSTAAIYLNQNICLGKKEDTKDNEIIGSIKEDAGIKTRTEEYYYTHYNHMTAEEYAAKYNNAAYTEKGNVEFNKDNYALYNTYKKSVTEDIGGTMTDIEVTVNEYRWTIDIPDGKYLFAIDEVRQALSKSIDRTAIANAVVYAKAAGAVVPNGVYNEEKYKKTFRDNGSDYISLSADVDGARSLLASIPDLADYPFELTVRAEDEVHCYIGEKVVEVWKSIGFNVTLVKVEPFVSLGADKTEDTDDIITEALWNRTYQATLVDIVAPTVSAFSVLAPFATEFAGTGINMTAKDEDGNYVYKIEGHITGYNSEEFNAKIEAAYASDDVAEIANLLHEAEQILMGDLPVIPIIYNKEAYLVSKELSKVKHSIIGTRIFTDAKLKDYHKYIVEETQA